MFLSPSHHQSILGPFVLLKKLFVNQLTNHVLLEYSSQMQKFLNGSGNACSKTTPHI